MALLIGAVYVTTPASDDRTVAHPILRPGGRVGLYQLVERVQSLPASYSLPPPRMDAQSKLGGGAAAWLYALALPDSEHPFNETNSGLALPEVPAKTEGGLPEAFSARQRSLPAPVPSGAFKPPARGLPKPFEEELESIAANRRYRLHRGQPDAGPVVRSLGHSRRRRHRSR